MKTIISLVILAAVALSSGCTKPASRTEWSLLSQREKTEVRTQNGHTERFIRLEIEIACPQRFPGPLSIEETTKDPEGHVLTDVIPSFGVTDSKKKRTVYLFIRETDAMRHPYAVFSATIGSDGVAPIYVSYQLKQKEA